jgi:hypothetical protein
MGISAEQWGKQAWHFLHTICYNYPEKPTETDKKNYADYIDAFQRVLPCPYCAEHFKQNLAIIPPKFDNQTDLFNWSVDIHNEVNKSNGKPVLSYEEALTELFNNFKTKEQINEDMRIKSIEAHLILTKIKKLKR